jgi:NitT/TauT family transport system permease protein
MKKFLKEFSVLASFFLIWEMAVRLLDVPTFILPTPTEIFLEIYENFYLLMNHTSITFLETFMGLIIGAFFGLLIALIFAYDKRIKDSIYPYFVTIKTIPIIALTPLIILWFGHGLVSKIVIVSLACFFPILVNATKGFLTITESHRDLFRSLQVSKLGTFVHLRLPSALPYIFTGLKISVTLAVLGAIVGEFVGSDKGLGYLMVLSSTYLETPTLFAAIIMTAMIGLILYLIVNYLERKIVFWGREE